MDVRFTLSRESDGSFSVHPYVNGAEQDSFVFEFQRSSVADTLDRIEDGVSSRDDLNEIGSRLWHAICPKPLRDSVNVSVAADEKVTLRLDLPVDGDLDALPWEALFDISTNQPLGCESAFVLLRTPPRDAPLRAWRRTRAGGVRVLVVVPEDSYLRVDYEIKNLERLARSLGNDRITLEVLSGRVTVDALDKRLAENAWDVLHFIGHGECAVDGAVSIRLNGDQPNSDCWLDALTFAQLLAPRRLQLAFLNCCLGAAPAKSRTLSGLGPHLSRTARIPAVVAMRYEILDSDSIRFAEVFYRELLDGAARGRIDMAVQSGRWSLLINRSELARSFATPVVYIEDAREMLFDIAVVEPPPPPLRRSRVDLPQRLIRSFASGRCIPVVGSGLHSADFYRRGGSQACVPSLFQVMKRVADESNYPEKAEVVFAETAGEDFVIAMISRVFQHFQREFGRFELVQKLRDICLRDAIPEPLAMVASWKTPGYVYAHFDGLLEEALVRAGKAPRTVNVFVKSAAKARVTPLLLNLRGSLREGVVLTERDQDDRLEQLAKPDPDVFDLVAGESGRSMLFLGASPRDILVRRICSQHLEAEDTTMQGPRFFVTPRSSPPDIAWWQMLKVEWINADPLEVVETLTAIAENRP